jgi:hypothetical protein
MSYVRLEKCKKKEYHPLAYLLFKHFIPPPAFINNETYIPSTRISSQSIKDWISVASVIKSENTMTLETEKGYFTAQNNHIDEFNLVIP